MERRTVKETHDRDQSYSADPVLAKLKELYHDLLAHDGFGDMRLTMRILKRGQKEVILHCGKQYRFVVDVAGRGRKGGKEGTSNTASCRKGGDTYRDESA
jgi:hypothetical protein